MNPTSGQTSAGGDDVPPTAAAVGSTIAPQTTVGSSCRFVVTGFGPFCGVPDNPTSELVRRFRDRAEAGGAVLESHVMETSAGHVRAEIDGIYGRLKSASDDRVGVDGNIANDDARLDGGVVTVVLHLGVDYNATRFKLERCAYNDATFRVPDERGYLPNHECISLIREEGDDGDKSETSSHEWGKCVETTLDLDDICGQLQKHNEAVIVSRDPGRFVCNYTYYLSLSRCRSINDEVCKNNHNDSGGKHALRRHHALFVHVPPFDVVPERRQLDFILRVVETIERHVTEV